MASTSRSPAGEVVAITGGARGIGRATAAALVQEGARVAIGDLDLFAARAAAERLGPAATAHGLDVTARESFAGFLQEVERDVGGIDVLINNAGIMCLATSLEAEDDATARRQVDINLHGVILGCKLALPALRRRGRGHLINVASLAGKAGFPGAATYSATKHAVVGLSEAIRAELRGSGVEVSVVMPVIVNTELAGGVRPGRFVKRVEPQDVAAAIVAAIRQPRFDVYVPREVGVLDHMAGMLPRHAREAVGRLLSTDRVLAGADGARRAGYEHRARTPVSQSEERGR